MLWTRTLLMLSHLQNIFLIEQVATARGFPNAQLLLNAAMEMLELSNVFWVKRDELFDYYSNFDWIVSVLS